MLAATTEGVVVLLLAGAARADACSFAAIKEVSSSPAGAGSRPVALVRG
jgi:hypothetical protein